MKWCCIVVKSSGVYFLSSGIINISAVVAVVTMCVQQSMQINKTQTESCRRDGKHRCILLCLRPGHLVLLWHIRQNQWWRSVLIHSHVSSYSLIVIWSLNQHVSSGKKKKKAFWTLRSNWATPFLSQKLVFNRPWVKKNDIFGARPPWKPFVINLVCHFENAGRVWRFSRLSLSQHVTHTKPSIYCGQRIISGVSSVAQVILWSVSIHQHTARLIHCGDMKHLSDDPILIPFFSHKLPVCMCVLQILTHIWEKHPVCASNSA